MTSSGGKPDRMAQEVYEGLVVARRLREELGLRLVQPVDCVVELVEERLALEVMIAPSAARSLGFYLPVEPVPIVAVEQDHPVQRQRFTIAHELGHHALGHAAAPRIHGEVGAATTSGSPAGAAATRRRSRAPQQPPRPRRHPPTTRATTRRAARRTPKSGARNAFAGELLIPEEGARVVAMRSVGAPPLDRAVLLSAHFGCRHLRPSSNCRRSACSTPNRPGRRGGSSKPAPTMRATPNWSWPRSTTPSSATPMPAAALGAHRLRGRAIARLRAELDSQA